MLVGLSDFAQLRKSGIYVDKTDILDEISPVIQSSASLILNRPRRFGKSLMVSMIEAFYSFDRDSRECFEGLKIASSPNFSHLNQYPVITVSFKNASSVDPALMLSSIKKALSSLFAFWADRLLPCCSPRENSFYNSILEGTCAEDDYALCLNSLCVLINKAYGKKPIILIDEYDAPIESSYGSEQYKSILSFLKSLYIATFQDTDAFGYGFITGVFGIAKGTLGTGLNNIPVDSGQTSILSKNYFGFSRPEVEKLCLRYHISEEDKRRLWDYYGGYEFLGEQFYNPWSVLNYLATRSFSSFWGNSGSNKAFSQIISSPFVLAEDLSALLRDGVDAQLDFSCSYEDVESGFDNSLLYLSLAGYLSLHPLGFNRFHVYLPNEETKDAFLREIIERYKDKPSLRKAQLLRKAMQLGNEEMLTSFLGDFLLSSLSYYDFSDEKNYQIMVGTLSALIFDEAIVKFEAIAGTGRCDIMISPLHEGGFGAVIEIKYIATRTSSARLKEKAQTALRQILKKGYVQELRLRKCEKILAFGISFFKNNVSVVSENLTEAS